MAALTDLAGQTGVTIAMVLKAAADLSTGTDPISLSRMTTWAWGTGANQVNVIWHDQRTLADGANETLNIYDSGTLKDAFGNLLTMTSIKFLYIKNYSADATLKVLGGGANDLGIMGDTSDIVLLSPGAEFFWSNPTAAGVPCGADKNIKLEHNGTGVDTLTYDILIMGED